MYILKNQIVLRRNGKMSTLTIKHMPYGDMAIIAMRGCEEFASKVDYYLLQWRGMPDLLLVQGGKRCRFITDTRKCFTRNSRKGSLNSSGQHSTSPSPS